MNKISLKLAFIISVAVITLLSITTPSYAILTIDVSDISKNQLYVTYEVADNNNGSREFKMPGPGNGGLFWGQAENIKIEKIVEINSGAEFTGEIIVHKDNDQKWREMRIEYASSNPADNHYRFRVKLLFTSKDLCYIDELGQLTVKYTTAYEAVFNLPAGYEEVYHNFPAKTSSKGTVQSIHTDLDDNFNGSNHDSYKIHDLVIKARQKAHAENK